MFKIGDLVVYTPNIANLPPAFMRNNDHGIILGIDNNYIKFRFNISGSIHNILSDAISHLNNYKHIMDKIIKSIPWAFQLRKARQIMKAKFNL